MQLQQPNMCDGRYTPLASSSTSSASASLPLGFAPVASSMLSCNGRITLQLLLDTMGAIAPMQMFFGMSTPVAGNCCAFESRH